MKHIISLDIGGTSIKSAIVNSSGEFFNNSYKITTLDTSKDKDYIIDKFKHTIKEKIDILSKSNSSFDGLTIAICGPFDYEKGISLIQNFNKYDSIYNLNIKKILQQKLDLPYNLQFVFDPDSWCFGRGEICFGNYKDYKKIIVFTMGTGVGSCFIDNKKVVSEGKGVPELGWISGQKFKDGILNDYISSIYMIDKYFKITQEKIDIKTMAERARKNDKNAKFIFIEIGNTLGKFLKENFVEDFGTECIVFGGQISLSSNLFINEIKNQLSEIQSIKKIVQAKDINTAALKGAAQLLIDEN